MPSPNTITIKVYFDTRKLLRKIAAEKDKRIMWVLHELVKAEADKLNIK